MKKETDTWTSAEAKVHFSTLIERAHSHPQHIYRYGQPVAVLVDSELFHQQLAPHVSHLKKALEEITEINRTGDEGDVDYLPRTDRFNLDETFD